MVVHASMTRSVPIRVLLMVTTHVAALRKSLTLRMLHRLLLLVRGAATHVTARLPRYICSATVRGTAIAWAILLAHVGWMACGMVDATVVWRVMAVSGALVHTLGIVKSHLIRLSMLLHVDVIGLAMLLHVLVFIDRIVYSRVLHFKKLIDGYLGKKVEMIDQYLVIKACFL